MIPIVQNKTPASPMVGGRGGKRRDMSSIFKGKEPTMKTIKDYKGFLLGLLLGAITILAMGSVINPSMSSGETGLYRLKTEVSTDYIYFALTNTRSGEVHVWKTSKRKIENRTTESD